jgi:hypothetical protein
MFMRYHMHRDGQTDAQTYSIKISVIHFFIPPHINAEMEKGNTLLLMVGRNKALTKVYPKVSGLAAWSENCKW